MESILQMQLAPNAWAKRCTKICFQVLAKIGTTSTKFSNNEFLSNHLYKSFSHVKIH